MIGLVDCNNFFVSCERLFRPDLLRKPVAVLSSNDGCVVARSQEVKDLGISMGIPFFEVKDICEKHTVTLFSSNFALYRDISRRVMSAVREEFSRYEVYSIDEAFFEIQETLKEEDIVEIRARIIQKTGIPVSIGIANTKTLAKVANSIAKNRKVGHPMSDFEGVCILNEDEWGGVQKEISCGSVWGIGRQTSALLSRMKIYTVADFLAQDRACIRQLLGIVGERLHLELSGVPVYRLGELGDTEQQSYMSTRSFEHPVRDKATLLSALAYHTAHLAEKLRKDGMTTSSVSIIARGSRFGDFAHRTGSAHAILEIPTNDTLVLTKEVSRLLNTIYDPEIPYKKAGVIVGAITPSYATPASLFVDQYQVDSASKRNTVIDFLNKKFGSGAIRTGVTMQAPLWQDRRKLKSNEYTTKWSDIAFVTAN